MEQIASVDRNKFHQICRCCLMEIPKINVIIDNLSFLLQTLFSIEVRDDLPHNICNVCANEIFRICEFRKKVIDSNKILSSVVVSQTVKIEPDAEQEAVVVDNQTSDSDTVQTEIPSEDVIKIEENELKLEQPEIEEQRSEKMWSSQNVFFCSLCNRKYKDKKSYRRHKYYKHKTLQIKKKTDPFKCDICYKIYRSTFSLKTHMLTHGEKNFLCSACGKGFFTKDRLDVHFRIHSGEMPYTCDLCNRTFRYLTCLQTHKVTHTGERPFTCKICSKTYTQSAHLRAHMVTHVEEKFFACGFCNKKYRYLTGLIAHKRTHTGQLPFSCSQCDQSFYSHGSLKKHQTTHINIEDKTNENVKH